MRLIDADALIEEATKLHIDDFMIIKAMVDRQPTVIELSCQCKDCIYWADDVAGYTEHVKHCLIGNYMIGKNGFCVYGEKKKDDWKESVMNHFTKVE